MVGFGKLNWLHNIFVTQTLFLVYVTSCLSRHFAQKWCLQLVFVIALGCGASKGTLQTKWSGNKNRLCTLLQANSGSLVYLIVFLILFLARKMGPSWSPIVGPCVTWRWTLWLCSFWENQITERWLQLSNKQPCLDQVDSTSLQDSITETCVLSEIADNVGTVHHTTVGRMDRGFVFCTIMYLRGGQVPLGI